MGKKYLILSAILIIFIMTNNPLVAQQKYIIVDYDKFENETIIRTKPDITDDIDPEQQPIFSIAIWCQGQNISKENIKLIFMHFISKSSKWKFLSYYQIKCLADEKPLELPGKPDHKGDILSSGDVLEQIFLNIDYPILEKLWNARKLEFKVGTMEFIIRQPEMEALQELKALFVK